MQLTRIEWAILHAERPRTAGKNARLDEHGRIIRLPIARFTAADGQTGFGWSRLTPERACQLLHTELPTTLKDICADPALRDIEYPLLDLLAASSNLPVWRWTMPPARPSSLIEEQRPTIACYDTTLYFDDLHLRDLQAAADYMADEAIEGYEQGHRAFKIKVGRGARHLPLSEGMQRDIAIVKAIRVAVGPQCLLMADANNGFNLNLTKHFLEQTAECHLYWLEEPFHEDPVLWEDLRRWCQTHNLHILLADGEGLAANSLVNWAQRGLLDIIQYDIIHPGFLFWLNLVPQLDHFNIRAAPHSYGNLYGNYVSGHLAPSLQGFLMIEWDEASTPALDRTRYSVQNGHVSLPNVPGFGLGLNEAAFHQAVTETGWIIP